MTTMVIYIDDEKIYVDDDYSDTSSPPWSPLFTRLALEVENQDSCLPCKVANDDGGDFDDLDHDHDHDHDDFDDHDGDDDDDIRDRGIQTEPRPSLLRQLCLCFLSNQVPYYSYWYTPTAGGILLLTYSYCYFPPHRHPN